jgi:hypothetical protein
MSRSFFSLAVTCGVGLSALLYASPVAAEKTKLWPSSKSGSAKSRSIGSSSSSSNGFSTKKFQNMNSPGANTMGGTNGLNSKGLKLGKQKTGPLKFKQPLNLGGTNGFQNGSGPANNGLVPYTAPNFGPRGNARPMLPAFDSNKIADALKDSKIKPIQPNFGLGQAGNGGAGNGILDQIGGRGNLADDIRDDLVIDDNVFNPPGMDNSGPGDAVDPGQGGNGQADPNPGDDDDHGAEVPIDPHHPHDDDDCDHDWPFPWWPPVIIGGGGCHNCPPADITVIEQPYVVQTLPASVDLQIVDVRIVDSGDATQNRGPRYRLVFANAGTVAVSNFQVMAMASLDGKPSPTAPIATAEVVTLAPGQVASVDVRLPLTADLSTMGALIVVIDSAVQIAETDEQNNVAILDRTKIAAVDAATTAMQ